MRNGIVLHSRLRAGRVADGKYTPQKNALTQSNVATAESVARVTDLCRRVRHGACLFFVF